MQLTTFKEEHVDEALKIVEAYLGLAFNVAIDENTLLTYTNTPYSLTLTHNNEVIGIILTRTFGNIASIDILAVKPKHIGKGYGKILLNKCLQTLRKHGIKRVELTVSTNAIEAISLYIKQGFKTKSIYYKLTTTIKRLREVAQNIRQENWKPQLANINLKHLAKYNATDENNIKGKTITILHNHKPIGFITITEIKRAIRVIGDITQKHTK